MKLKNLDKKDLAILRELDKDVRASFTQIGKRTKLSKEVVQYRMNRLQEKGILTGFICYPKIGSEHIAHKILLKNKSLSKENKKAFLEWVVKQKVVSWLASTQGNWDFIITSITRKHEDFAVFFQNLMKKFGSHFKEKHILQSSEFTFINEKYLHEKGELIHTTKNDLLQATIIQDELDQKINILFSENARASFTNIAKKVNLTAEAISYRFKKSHLQGFSPRINHKKLGLEYHHIFIAMDDFTKLETICNYYTQHPQVVFFMKHIGYYDLHLEVVLPIGEAENFIDELTGKFGEAIAHYDLLRIAKEHFIQVMR